MSMASARHGMDWKRERDGLAVVVGAVVVVGIVLAGGSAGRFLTTLVATFLGVLLALRVDGYLGGVTAVATAATPTGEADRPGRERVTGPAVEESNEDRDPDAQESTGSTADAEEGTGSTADVDSDEGRS